MKRLFHHTKRPTEDWEGYEDSDFDWGDGEEEACYGEEEPEDDFSEDEEAYYEEEAEDDYSGEEDYIAEEAETDFSEEEAEYYEEEPETGFSEEEAEYYVQEPETGFSEEEAEYYEEESETGISEEEAEYYVQESETGFPEEEAEYYVQEPAAGFSEEEAECYVQEPAAGFSEEEAEYYVQEPAAGFSEEEAEYYVQEPETGFSEEETEYYAQEPETGFHEEETEYYVQEPAAGFSEEEVGYYEEEPETGFSGEEAYYAGTEAEYYEETDYVSENVEYSDSRVTAEQKGNGGTGQFYPGNDGVIRYEDDSLYAVGQDEEDTKGAVSGKRSTGNADGGKPKSAGGRKGGLAEKLREMPVLDRAIAFTGAAVLLLALITGGAFLSSRLSGNRTSDFVSVGTQLEDISVIGEAGLIAIADAQRAKLAAAVIVDEDQKEEQEHPDYEENDYSRQVTVAMNMTSIQKDLKIKFINQKTGKLIANVPFSVTVTDPDGKVSIWSDDDKDGIIYKKDIASGAYKVAIETLTDQKYADYAISTDKKSVDVKKDIAYQKVDVTDEVKSESEVDAKKEDTAKNEVAIESELQDTVAWVDSKVIDAVYSEVPKSSIPDPLTFASLSGRFMRMTTAAAISPAAVTLKAGETQKLTASHNYQPVLSAGESLVGSVSAPEGATWTSSAPEVAAVGSDGTVTAASPGTATITWQAKVTYQVKKGESVSDNDAAALDNRTEELKGTCVVTVASAAKGTLTVDKPSVAVVIKGNAVIQTTAAGFEKEKKLTYKAVSDQPSVATVSVDTAGKVTVTGVAAGTARITVTANYADGTAATEAAATIDVTVGANKIVAFDKTTCTAYAANPIVLNVTIQNAATKSPTVTVESSDAAVLRGTVGALKTEGNVITVPVTVEALKEGSATLTVKCLENGEEVRASCVVTVKPNPKTDEKTELKDKDGHPLYVFENDKYRPAHHADYYKFDKFFQKSGERYTGWQTLDGKVYFFNADGNKVTGEQVIQGAKYAFASDGSLVTGTGALGIDVSKWNGTIDWTAVKNSGVNYVIIRCGYRGSSQGKLVEDPKFTANIKGATAAGLKVGVYFFTQAIDEREAVEEASMVLEQIKNYKISYPVFLDVESSGGRADSISKEQRTAVCKAFCQTIQNANYTAGIYANKSWLENKLNASELSAYKIWLAQYASAPTYKGRYDLWQYRSTGKVTGINGNVDMNLSYLGY